MPYSADLHTHSQYANACSPQLTIPNLAKWAHLKGIDLLSTGDCLFRAHLENLKKELQPLPSGLYEHGGIKFILGTEVSCVYTEFGKGRRVHILLYLPSITSAEKLKNELKALDVNIDYEGRPMINFSVKKLCEVVFKIEPRAIIIPAHIWTPWFGMFGSKSGFDFFGQCFGEFSEKIYAVETGLSSDPLMNWRVSDLDKKTIVSFSDVHSLPRLGREVTYFDGEFSYDGLLDALRTEKVLGTIEFYPEEGKYHFSGHRKCGVVLDSKKLLENGPICPKCGKDLTLGVESRIEDLATRTNEDLKIIEQNGSIKSELLPHRPGFKKLIQLEEIIAESFEQNVQTQKVQQKYEQMVTTIDPELKLLTQTPIDMIAMSSGKRIAEGIKRVREGKVTIEPGFDNTYGKIKIWQDEEDIGISD